MRYAIPVLSRRVSPRCTIAETVLVVEARAGEVINSQRLNAPGRTWMELFSTLATERIDVLVCGGISREARQALRARNITVVDNVAATIDSVIGAIATGELRPGYGFDSDGRDGGDPDIVPAGVSFHRDAGARDRGAAAGSRPPESGAPDCLACADRVCLLGDPCPSFARRGGAGPHGNTRRILEATHDIACEDERVLCRLSELIYFGLEMGYRRIGVAFCWDLLEATRILVGVMRRFFDVVPIGCKINRPAAPAPGRNFMGTESPLPSRYIPCNPRGQALALARAGSELNVAVGLCMGADCLFAQASRAPVSTLFVKDRSFAKQPHRGIVQRSLLKGSAASVRG